MPHEVKMVSTDYDPNRGVTPDASPDARNAISPQTLAVLKAMREAQLDRHLDVMGQDQAGMRRLLKELGVDVPIKEMPKVIEEIRQKMDFSTELLEVIEKIYPMDTELASVIESNAPISTELRKFFSRVLVDQNITGATRNYATDPLRMSDVALLTHRFSVFGFNPQSLLDLTGEIIVEDKEKEGQEKKVENDSTDGDDVAPKVPPEPPLKDTKIAITLLDELMRTPDYKAGSVKGLIEKLHKLCIQGAQHKQKQLSGE